MEKIRTLQLVESLEIGGIERVVATIAKGLSKDKYEVSIWSIVKGGDIAEELKKEGKDLKVLNISNYYNPLNILKFANLVKKEKFSILHTHGYFASTMGRVAARLAKVPIIITHVHSTYLHYTKRNLYIERLLSNYTDKIICCSDAVKEFVVEKEKITENKVVTIYNGINRKDIFSDIHSIRQSFGIGECDILITTIGSLFPHKGQRYLLDAVYQVIKDYKDIKCFIIGDGPLREELKNYANDLGLESNVSFLGLKKDISEILSATDIFVLPSSEREGLPIAILEAMAYGKPVVASRIGGIPELVTDGVNGYLVPPQNSDALAEKIGMLIADRLKREKMGWEARRYFDKEFSAEKFLREIDKLYQEIVNRKLKKETF